jgi:hypothetical protein
MSCSGNPFGNSSFNLGTIPNLVQEIEKTRHRSLGHRSAFNSFRVGFDLSANQLDLLRDASSYLPLECIPGDSDLTGLHYSLVHCPSSSGSEEAQFKLYRNGRRLFTCGNKRDLFERLGAIVSLDVADASPNRTFVHAGVVGWGNSAILIPGRSFSGKTTLVAELIRAGATYYSDEFAVIDRDGLVGPYARPLQVRENGSHRQVQRAVEEFGAVAGRKPLPVRLILISRYRPDARWNPRQLSPGIGLLKLLDNTVSARRSPAIALSTLKQVVSGALIARGVRGEASHVVEWIIEHFGSPQTLTEPAQ